MARADVCRGLKKALALLGLIGFAGEHSAYVVAKSAWIDIEASLLGLAIVASMKNGDSAICGFVTEKGQARIGGIGIDLPNTGVLGAKPVPPR
jgi:hypothetical protein